MKPLQVTSCTMVKKYYTIRISRTVAHVFCLCLAITLVTLLIAVPTLDKKAGSSTSGIMNVRGADSGEIDDDVLDEPIVLVEYDPAEAARKHDEEKRREREAREARARADAARRREEYIGGRRERDRDRDLERLREREGSRDKVDTRIDPVHQDSRAREDTRIREPVMTDTRQRAPVREDTRAVAPRSGKIGLPNGMKGCARASPFGRGYNVDLDSLGQLNPTCPMDQAQVTRNVRNTTLKSLCAVEEVNHISMLTSDQRRTLDPQVLVDDAHKFIYCFVPKVACSNWKRVIKYINNKVADLDTPMKMDHHKDLVFLNQFSEEEVEYRLKNYFKFMFVRDPTERLLSAYKNKFGQNIGTYNEKYGPKIIAKYRKPGTIIEGDDQSRITFEEFLRFVVDSDNRKMDPHWRPMHELCQPCVMNYDFIGSFEQLIEDATLVINKVRGDSDAYFPQKQSYYQPTSDEAKRKQIRSVHTGYMKQFVDKYARDYMLFGYPPPVSDVTKRKTL